MQTGDVVAGRFVLERFAASGGMAAVFRALDRQTGGPVALKVSYGHTAVELRRFAREADLLSKLRDPGIVRCVAHGISSNSGVAYLALEWLDGEDLHQRLTRAGLTVRESLELMLSAARALGEAHAAGLIHRDIKPSNLFLVDGDPGRVKLLDFGIALGPGIFTELKGQPIGTPSYMSPEQVRADVAPDARSDVFSLGCVLYRCLTGQRAFDGESLMEVFGKLLTSDPIPPARLRPEVPEEIDRLVMRMLDKEPANRPSSASAILDEIEAALRHVGASDPRSAASEPRVDEERRLVSVMVAKLGEHAPPSSQGGKALDGAGAVELEALEQRIDLGRLQKLANAFNARVSYVPGTGLVAVVDSSLASDARVARTCRCALALFSALDGPPIAVATRRMVVSERWPLGDAMAAARELAAAAKSEVLVDAVTAELLDEGFVLEPQARGIRLLRHERGVAKLGPPRAAAWLGRDRELAQLVAMLDRVFEARRPQAALVVGDAGIGKSRLAAKLLEATKDRNLTTVCIGRGDPIGAGSPLAMAARALKSALAIRDGDDGPRQRDIIASRVASLVKLKARLDTLAAMDAELSGKLHNKLRGGEPADADEAATLRVRSGTVRLRSGTMRLRNESSATLRAAGSPTAPVDLSRLSAYLSALLDVSPSRQQSLLLSAAHQDTRVMADGIRAAFCEWLRLEGTAADAVLVVLEDLHWGDLASVLLIDRALAELTDTPLFVLATARPEIDLLFPALWRERPVERMMLDELGHADAGALVRAELPDATEATVADIVARAGGNPFYLGELARAAGQGAVVVPEKVLLSAATRLEELEPEARRVLRAASVFGETFTMAGLLAVLGGGHARLCERWLPQLVQDGILTRRAEGENGGEPVYAFQHELLRQAAYAMISDRDRAAAHRLAAGWLDELAANDALLLAEQWVRGDAPERAVDHFARAARQALGGHDFRSALSYVERALASGASGPALGALKLLAADAHEWAADNTARADAAREALSLLPPGSPSWFAAFEHALITMLQFDEIEAAVLLCRELEQLPPQPASAAEVVARARAAGQLIMAGRVEHGLRFLADAEARSAGIEGSLRMDAWLSWARAWRALSRRDLSGALAFDIAAAEAFEAAGDVRNACYARANVGYEQLRFGLFQEAEAALSSAYFTADRLGLVAVAGTAAHNLGLVLAYTGRLDEARVVEELAIELLETAKVQRTEASSHDYLARIALLAGDVDAAERSSRRAVALASANAALRPIFEATLARALLARGNPRQAIDLARGAMRLLEEQGDTDGEGHYIRWVHLEALVEAGKLGEARTAAARALRELERDAGGITAVPLRHSFLTNVREHARIVELSAALGASS